MMPSHPPPLLQSNAEAKAADLEDKLRRILKHIESRAFAWQFLAEDNKDGRIWKHTAAAGYELLDEVREIVGDEQEEAEEGVG